MGNRTLYTISQPPTGPYTQITLTTRDTPAFRGHFSDGDDWYCGNCKQSKLLDNIFNGEIYDIFVKCFNCGTLNCSPALPPGTPLAKNAICMAEGEHSFSRTVELHRERQIAGVRALNQHVWQKDFRSDSLLVLKTAKRIEPYSVFVTIQLTKSFFSTFIYKIYESFQLSIRSKTPSKNPHRLMTNFRSIGGLLTSSGPDELLKKLETFPVDLGALSELHTTLTIMDKWKFHPAYPNIVDSMIDNSNYCHNVILFGTATALSAMGNAVDLHVESMESKRGADLRIFTGSRSRVSLEIKTPQRLQLRDCHFLPEDYTEILEKCFKKAGTGQEGQLGGQYPGILVIGGFRGSGQELDLFATCVEEWFRRRPGRKTGLAACVLVSVGTSTADFLNRLEASCVLTNKIIKNPWYTGPTIF